MIRVLIFFALVLVLAIGFAWLADRPGELTVTFGGYRYEVSLMVASVAIATLAAAVLLSWWVVAGIWNSPRSLRRYFRARRRDRGYQSLSTGLIAAGAGDSGLARRMHKQASGLLSADQEPLLHLLEAQALLLEGRHDEARRRFEAMAGDPETRLLGLRGLYLEARRQGDHEAARHYAEEAAKTAPQLGWAANSAIGARLLEGDYDGALRLISGQAASGDLPRAEIDRRRAVLLTAKAMALLDSDLATARSAAMEAHRLQPDFVPAAVIAARAAFRHDELRKGSRILEQVWKLSPHPEIAEAYIHARAGDSAQDRLARARRLHSLRPEHAESELALARAAYEAGEYAEARRAVEAAIRMEPRESAYLLLADIEEADTGDQGRIREWLARAVRAPRDPAWTADGHVSPRWLPVSPVTGTIGAFEWRVPVERLGPVIESDASGAPPITEPAALEAAAPKEQETASAPPEPAPPQPVMPEPAQVPAAPAAERLAEQEAELVQPPIPDDPGVEEEDSPERARGYRLF